MKKAAVIGLILATTMSMSLAACGDKGPSGAASTTRGEEVSSASQEAAAASQETEAAPDAAAGENGNDAAGPDGTTAAGENRTGPAGENVTDPAGGNTTAAGGNTTGSSGPAAPLLLDPPSMKTAYQPETDDQKYARELAGIYLLTDLKDTLFKETGEEAARLQAEGRPMYLEFFSNGTMRETVFGDPMGGLWDREYLTLGSDRVSYTFSGDHVTVSTDTMNLTFTRTTQEELDMLLAEGEESADGEEAAGETLDNAADGTADDAAAGDTASAGTGKGRRKERIIKAASSEETAGGENATSQSGDEEAGTEGIADGSTEEDLYGTAAEDVYGTEDGTAAEDVYGTEDGTLSGDAAETEPAAEEEAAVPQMEEYVISDDLCSMVATGYDFSDPGGLRIHVRCENYSVNNLAFNIQDAVVNNVMFEPGMPEGEEHWTLEVEPLSTRESDIVFRADTAAEYGITSFDYVLLDLWVRNMDSWMDDPIYMGDKELYPTDNVTATGEGIQNVERRSAAGEQKIAEENRFNFTVLGSEVQANGDYVLKVCIENKSWQNLTFTWDDVYVNGTLLDPFWAVEVLPGTICYDDVVFTAADLAEKGVSAVSDVSFTMSVADSKNWLSYAIYTETSTYRA